MRRLVPVLSVVAVATLAGCGSKEKAAPEKKTSVVARRPTKLDLPVKLHYPAELRALRETDIQPLEVSGYVTELLVDRGDSVKPGQLLAKLDCSAYADERTRRRESVRQLEAQTAFAKQTVDRLRPMLERQFLGAQDMAKAEAEAAQADAAAAAAQASLRTAETRVRDCALTAPFAGDITARYVDIGTRVSPGTALFTLTDGKRLRATVDLVDRDAAKVRPGQSAELSVDGYGNETFHGRVDRVVKALARSTRTLRAEVEIDNTAERLRPGMFARIGITAETRPGAILVPASALLVQESNVSVFLAEGNTSRRREVTLGYDDGEWVEVTSGLNPESLVIVQGKDLLADGSRIEVRVDPSSSAPSLAAPPPNAKQVVVAEPGTTSPAKLETKPAKKPAPEAQ